MTEGVFTWDALRLLGSNILLVVNSTTDDASSVAVVVQELQVGDNLPHVVAPPQWEGRLAAWGLSSDRMLLAVDQTGEELELNHFLETPAAVRWIVPKRFRAIIGSSPHNLYNEEIKDIFEQRVMLLLGDGRFLAHTLPLPYVYVFDLAGLVRRLGRERKRRDYLRRCRALIDECHRHWQAHGEPAESSDPASSEMLDLLGRHVGTAIVAFDEAAPVPLEPPDSVGDVADLVAHLRDVLYRHDEELAERAEAVKVRETMLAQLEAERNDAVKVRDDLLLECRTERNEAVRVRDDLVARLSAERIDAATIRDALIHELRRKQKLLTRGLRRWIVGRD